MLFQIGRSPEVIIITCMKLDGIRRIIGVRICAELGIMLLRDAILRTRLEVIRRRGRRTNRLRRTVRFCWDRRRVRAGRRE